MDNYYSCHRVSAEFVRPEVRLKMRALLLVCCLFGTVASMPPLASSTEVWRVDVESRVTREAHSTVDDGHHHEEESEGVHDETTVRTICCAS